MSRAREIAELNRELSDAIRAGEMRRAIALARELPDDVPMWFPYHELWWHFCERIGDAVQASDPRLAVRLYAIALDSHRKEGSMASGAGEGMMSIRHQEELATKLANAEEATQNIPEG